MNDFLKYLTPGERDKEWGLFLNVAGMTRVNPNTAYPSPEHPTGYHFNWEQGRVLKEYQINYITEGKGVLDSEGTHYPIKPGSILITRPGVWHRYKPLRLTGWKEQYIGFNGSIASQFFSHSFFLPTQPVINIGIREEILDTYLKIFNLIKEEKPGFQQIASGLVIKLMGYIFSFETQKEFTGKHVAAIIEEVRFTMREKVDQVIDMEKLAQEHRIGYSYFRKMFRSYTGVAPHQYHLELKIMRAKELLLSTNKSIKEISFALGFQSIHYFSRVLKNTVGIAPSEFRK